MHSLMNDSMSGISTTELVPQIFDDFLTGVTIVNKKSEIVYYNKAQGHIDNMNPDDVLGKSINDVHKVGEGVAHPTMLAIISRRPLVNHSFCYTTLSGKLVNSVQNIFAIVKDGESLGCATFMSEYGSILEAYNLGKDDDPSKASPDAAFRESPRLGEDSFNQLVTNDKDMFESLEIVAKALDTPSPILIRGEKGVEKDILAKMIHNGSSRRDGPFFVLNCASGQENILEGILFGTVEGAFSSAVDRPGMLELADGGTLFLDEIDAMPPALQTKLARTLSEGKVRRVGSSNSDTGFSVKIVSSTSVEPKEGVAGRILNPELVLRLGVVIVNLPPLRNRKSDIALLCDHFIGKMNLKLGKNVTGLDDELKPAFNGHDWPGNVRELESAIEGAMNMIPENETVLRFQHFNATLLSVFLKGALARTDSDAKTPHFLNRPAEAERIAAALEAAGGNAAKAARSLKISPQLMNYKLKKFSLKKKITVHVE